MGYAIFRGMETATSLTPQQHARLETMSRTSPEVRVAGWQQDEGPILVNGSALRVYLDRRGNLVPITDPR